MNEENFKNENINDVDDTPTESDIIEKVNDVTEEVPDTEVEDKTEAPVTGFVTGIVTDCLRLNIRKEPRRYADVVCVVDALAKVTVNLDKSTEDWYRVTTEKGFGGYCMKKFVTVK